MVNNLKKSFINSISFKKNENLIEIIYYAFK